jgi:hypothetical protein
VHPILGRSLEKGRCTITDLTKCNDYKDIYYWVAYLKNKKQISSYDMPFLSLPFEDITIFEIKPIISGYAPIRIYTNGRRFLYFRRYIAEMPTNKIVKVYYIIQATHVYVVEYPDCQYHTFNNIEEFDKFLENRNDII